MKIEDITLEKLPAVAERIRQEFPNQQVFVFYGTMGSGKTTLIKELCKVFQVEEPVTSPTFALVNEYKTARQETIYHFDLYRLSKPEELLDIGFEEYIASNGICFIEWPEIAEDFLPENYVKILIEEDENHRRRLTLSQAHGH